MKKSLLFSGVIISITLLCCYALVAEDAVNASKAATKSAKPTVLPQPPSDPRSSGCTPDFYVDLDCATGYTNVANTCGAGNDCDTQDSEDHIYEIVIPEDGFYTFSLCNTDPAWNTKLFLDAECCAADHIAYNDDWCGELSDIQCVELTTGTYYLLVEGDASSYCGEYQLDITCCERPECPENTLFGQPPHMPLEDWDEVYSDFEDGSQYRFISFEKFYDVAGEICDIHWWGFSTKYGDNPQDCDEDPMDFEIKFYNGLASADLPDTANPVCTYNVTLNRQMTENTYHFDIRSIPLCYWSATLSPCCTMDSGWVSIQSTSVGTPDDCKFRWISSPDGDGTSLRYRYYGDSWTTLDFDLSICLTGEAEESCLQVERGDHFCLHFEEPGETIDVCWCCPEEGQPVFHYDPGCNYGLPGECDEDCPPYYGTLRWLEAAFVPNDTACDPLGGYWTTTFAIEDDTRVAGCVCVFFEYQLPVELTTLEAIAGDRQVTLNWTTASELDNDYFSILRNGIEIAQVDGAGNSQTALNYEYIDRSVVNGVTYTYRLTSRDINGTVHEYDQTVEATPNAPMPREYALDQNFPNPFNPNTSISYALKEAGFVTLNIYNLMGQEVATLVEKELSAGRYTATFTANDLPSGVYVYRLEVNDFSAQKKMILLK